MTRFRIIATDDQPSHFADTRRAIALRHSPFWQKEIGPTSFKSLGVNLHYGD
jgi:hypothetical protein